MEDENSVTAICNANPTIELEITSYKNEVNIELVESIESAFSAHNVDLNAHDAHFTLIEAKIALKESTTDVDAALALKADLANTYTKTETDSAIATKIGSDVTTTRQGNTFNSASQLVQLNSTSQLPAVDGSQLKGLIQSQIKDLTTTLAAKEPYHSKYDSGWFAVAASASYTKTHNLNTKDFKYEILIADDINGTNQRHCSYWSNEGGTGARAYGYCETSRTTSILSLKTGDWVGLDINGYGATSGYYRILAEVI